MQVVLYEQNTEYMGGGAVEKEKMDGAGRQEIHHGAQILNKVQRH